MQRFLSSLALVGVIVVLLVIPVFGDYITWLTGNMLILSLFAVGFNLLFGYTGLLSFGHAGFFAVGGYVCAKILLATPSLLPGVIGGILAAGLVSLVLGYLCVRHTRIYFAMLTLAFGMMIHSIIWKWRSVTGGDDGLVGVPRAPLEIPGLFSLDMSDLTRFYYFVLLLVFLGIFALWRVVNSSLGLTLQCIRDSETRVAFSGLSVRKFRLIAFLISGLSAGLAGALMAPLGRSATPEMAHWTFSAEPVLATLLGGVHSFAGPIVGAFLFYIIKEIIVRFTGYWMMVLGIIVLILVLGFRGGVVSVFQDYLFPLLGFSAEKRRGDG
ncbi:MAG: branched-chain amino acid ABC transporter permease [Nitrospinota bacterium]|nr:MAG: branched-chain amino acid ABC transporter permease [Nitrospinota bacterium]